MSVKATELNTLKIALYYLHVEELKDHCIHLALPKNGKKGDLIYRILTYLRAGKIVKVQPIPEVSCAKKGTKYPLKANTLILHGSYKNDALTCAFMKTLVGEHFHFTAFGQDWIKERWLQGDPPTYAEFAKFWQDEHEARKKKDARPKQEWAYLNFIQRYTKNNPKASREELMTEWEKERKKQVALVKSILR